MLKKDLEKELERKNKQISRIYEECHNKTDELNNELENSKRKIEALEKSLEEEKYRSFKESILGNYVHKLFEEEIEEFMDNYIKENLSIELKCGDSGYVDVDLKLKDEYFSSKSGWISMRPNPYDE